MLKSMRLNAVSSMLLAWLAFTMLVPGAASAASVSLSATAQSALAKHISAAPLALKEKLDAQSLSLQTSQRQEDSLTAQYNAQHASNGKALEAVRQRIKLIDSEKITRLSNEVNAARERYKPLQEHYTALNRQIANAKAVKLKELAAALKKQAEVLQPVVQLARADIRIREDALKAAKASTAKTVKALKTTLADISPLHEQTKLAQSSVSGSKKTIPGVVKTLNACVKSGSHSGTLQSLTTLASLSKSIVEQKTRMIGYENRVTTIIDQVNTRIPAK